MTGGITTTNAFEGYHSNLKKHYIVRKNICGTPFLTFSEKKYTMKVYSYFFKFGYSQFKLVLIVQNETKVPLKSCRIIELIHSSSIILCIGITYGLYIPQHMSCEELLTSR